MFTSSLMMTEITEVLSEQIGTCRLLSVSGFTKDIRMSLAVVRNELLQKRLHSSVKKGVSKKPKFQFFEFQRGLSASQLSDFLFIIIIIITFVSRERGRVWSCFSHHFQRSGFDFKEVLERRSYLSGLLNDCWKKQSRAGDEAFFFLFFSGIDGRSSLIKPQSCGLD